MSYVKATTTSGLGSKLGIVASVILASGFLWTSEVSAVVFDSEGSEYSPSGSVSGDQIQPTLAFRGSGGWLVWQDNNTDGDGFGISARRLTAQLTGLSSIRINEVGIGDQENPQIVQFPEGSGLIIWQSGIRGSQQIIGRVLKPDGKFAGAEFKISDKGTDNREPTVAVGADGNALVVWEAEGVDGSMQGIQAQRISPLGERLGGSIIVNQYSAYHQRNPSVTALTSGGFVVVWISEHQRFQNSVDVFGRTLTTEAVSSTSEFLVNTSQNPCATPTVVSLLSGGFLAAWAEHDAEIPGAVWDVNLRSFSANGPKGGARRLNTRQEGFQGMPKLAAAADSILAIYRSNGGDGVGFGVTGQWLNSEGLAQEGEFIVNSRTAGDQLTPNLASDGSSRILAVWSTFGGSSKGMDLAAQRFTRTESPLVAPAAPHVFAASSSKLFITWPDLSGLTIKSYELYLDGSESPIVTTEGFRAVSGLAPSSMHSFRLAYVLNDGRKSPLSEVGTGSTWGEDDNADGLPDDWQAQHFGNNFSLWPAPEADTDGDGVNNRNEFLSGTDPRSELSLLRTQILHTSQGPILNWNCRAGSMYQVQSSLNLKDWVNVGAARFAAGESDSLYIGDLSSNAYYRINLLR